METKELLIKFMNKNGAAGLESEAAAFGKSLLEPFGPVELTPLGSVVCRVCPAAPGRPHLMLDAHIDEIGLIVTFIEDSGFLRVGACGGIDRRLLMASRVTVFGAAGPVNGVVCSTPPHLSDGEDKKNKKIEDIYIDIGADSKASAEALCRPGDRATLAAESRELLGDFISGKAIDDRAGCVALVKAIEYLGGFRPDFGLSVVFSAMEEVGGQGAGTAAYLLEPTHSIAVDVSFGFTPDSRREQCGDMKKGPMIGFAPILSHSMSAGLASLAQKHEIPFQYEIMSGKTGTNADHIAVSRGGVRAGLLSIPQKYMHTPVETVAISDVEDTARLITAFIREGELA